MRTDTTLSILDARKHIAGGYIVPFLTRAMDGRFYDIESRIAVARSPLAILDDHDRSTAGIVGLATCETRPQGLYATVQLYDHPHSAWYQEHIAQGQIAFSHDSAAPEKADSDGYIGETLLIAASLTAWPYTRPNYIASAEQYIALIERYCAQCGVESKFTDPALERAPIPARYQYDPVTS